MKQPDALASKGQAVEEWFDLHFFRPVGYRLTRALSPTRVTPDQVTVASLVVGLIAGHLFVYRGTMPNFIGVVLFVVSDILDSADGQLARLRGTSTHFGRILDGMADGVRFVNLYVHLGIRLVLGGGGWGAAVLALAALFSHTYQSLVVDFIKNAYRRLRGGERDTLDLSEPVETTGGGLLARFGGWVYRDYLSRQARMFPNTVQLARRLGNSDLPAAARTEWERLQLPVVANCAWVAQNIRFALLFTAVFGWPTGFMWITLIPLNLIALALVLVHERNALPMLQSLAMPAPTPAPVPPPGQDTPRMYRGAIVGLGGIAINAHLPGFARDPNVAGRFRIVAGVDGAPNVTAGTLPVVRNADQLLEFEPIDFVDICTPTASHLPLTLWALESGYHVICEKPVAINRAEAEQVTRAARRAGKVVFPCHQYRFNPVWQQIRKWINEGAIGRWHLAELSVHRLEADRGSAAAAAPWRGQKDSARGGVLLDHGTHLLYALMDIAGPPVSVDAWTAQLRHSYDVEDTANVVLEYPNAMATIFLTWAGHKRENHVRFIGERGTIAWSGGALTLEAGERNESLDLSAQMDKSSYAGWFSELFRAFAQAIDEEDIETHLADITSVATVLEAAYDSAASRRPRPISVG